VKSETVEEEGEKRKKRLTESARSRKAGGLCFLPSEERLSVEVLVFSAVIIVNDKKGRQRLFERYEGQKTDLREADKRLVK